MLAHLAGRAKTQKTLEEKIVCDDFDKYGRLLIMAFPEETDISNKNEDELFNISINNQMIKEGHGYSYKGGTKEEFI